MRSLSRKSRSRKELPKAFEVFTDDKCFVLKVSAHNVRRVWRISNVGQVVIYTRVKVSISAKRKLNP